jgi:hypothetical protein
MSTPLYTIANDDDLTHAVMDLAHINADRLTAMSSRQKQRAYVRDELKRHDVVWLVWEEDEGRHFYCIKGRNRLGRLKTTAFAVKGRADAIGMAEEWGDGAPHLAHEMPKAVM